MRVILFMHDPTGSPGPRRDVMLQLENPDLVRSCGSAVVYIQNMPAGRLDFKGSLWVKGYVMQVLAASS